MITTPNHSPEHAASHSAGFRKKKSRLHNLIPKRKEGREEEEEEEEWLEGVKSFH